MDTAEFLSAMFDVFNKYVMTQVDQRVDQRISEAIRANTDILNLNSIVETKVKEIVGQSPAVMSRDEIENMISDRIEERVEASMSDTRDDIEKLYGRLDDLDKAIEVDDIDGLDRYIKDEVETQISDIDFKAETIISIN